MTDLVDQVAAQLRIELGATAFRIGLLAGPDAAVEWERTIHGRCHGIARALCSPDKNEAAEALAPV